MAKPKNSSPNGDSAPMNRGASFEDSFHRLNEMAEQLEAGGLTLAEATNAESAAVFRSASSGGNSGGLPVRTQSENSSSWTRNLFGAGVASTRSSSAVLMTIGPLSSNMSGTSIRPSEPMAIKSERRGCSRLLEP